MIPKRIIYAWFGNGEKPRLVDKCMKTWDILNDYEIIELNEETFDINKYEYTKDAYNAKKWAFVADCAKMDYLYFNGGISLDTDIEILKPFDDLLNNKAFTSKESSGKWISAVIASEQYHPWIKTILHYYKTNKFEFCPTKITNTVIIDRINRNLYKTTDKDNVILKNDVIIYPKDFFECKNWTNGRIELSKNSYSIHHYIGSWLKREILKPSPNIEDNLIKKGKTPLDILVQNNISRTELMNLTLLLSNVSPNNQNLFSELLKYKHICRKMHKIIGELLNE